MSAEEIIMSERKIKQKIKVFLRPDFLSKKKVIGTATKMKYCFVQKARIITDDEIRRVNKFCDLLIRASDRSDRKRPRESGRIIKYTPVFELAHNMHIKPSIAGNIFFVMLNISNDVNNEDNITHINIISLDNRKLSILNKQLIAPIIDENKKPYKKKNGGPISRS